MLTNFLFALYFGATPVFRVSIASDIAVNSLARVAHDPKPAHWRALQHLGRYLGSTKSHALELRREGPDPGVVVYTDADYAPKYGTAFDNYRSTSGYVGYFGRSAISWRSRGHGPRLPRRQQAHR